MRIFEVVLIIVNLLAPTVRKQSKASWLWMAIVNLAVLNLHGIFESFRYQMMFSYIFVILFVVYALAKTNSKFFKVKIPNTLKFIGISMSLVTLAFTSFLAHALPVFRLPKPTGDYAVGITYFHLIDENRTDPFLDKSTKKRELMVKVYYPAKEDNSKPFSPYFHGSSELIRLLTSGYGMPIFTFDHLSLVKTHSKDDLKIWDRQSNYPVILFSHGAGTTMETQTSQSEDLASHGYIVVAVDHTYVSAGTVFPDKIVSAKGATTDFKAADPAEVITQIMADDDEFVIDTLEEWNQGKIDSIFKGKLNLDEIGVIGHSVGGAVAYNLAINDPRVKAAIDLDGTVFVNPNDPKNVAPFLMLANDRYHIQAIQSHKALMERYEDMDDVDRKIMMGMYGSEQAYKQAYNQAQQNMTGLTEVLKSSGNLFTIEGSDHMKFTDMGLFIGFRPLREMIGIGGKTDPARCLQITEALTLAFFDRQLKEENTASFQALIKKYPDLKEVNLN